MPLALPLDRVLARGVVLSARLGRDHLDDPAVATRSKFLVVLNCTCPADPIFVVLATSDTGRFGRLPHLRGETVPLDPANYDFLDRPTLLDFTDVQSFGLKELTTMLERGRLSVVVMPHRAAHAAAYQVRWCSVTSTWP